MFSLNPLYFIIPASEQQKEERRLVEKPTNPNRDKKLFSPYDALMGGNSFKDEYRGYKNYKPGLPSATNERQKLLMEIMAYALIAHDLGLYLDVYPHDKGELEEFEKYAKLANEKTMEYTKKYGPLTQRMSEEKNGALEYALVPSPWLGL